MKSTDKDLIADAHIAIGVLQEHTQYDDGEGDSGEAAAIKTIERLVARIQELTK